MRKTRTLATRMLLIVAAAICATTALPTLAQPPCDGSPGACFVPLMGGGTFFFADDSTGWTVYVTFSGDKDFLQLRQNGQAYLHIIDQEVALVAVNTEDGENPLVGTGRLTLDAFFDLTTGQFTCPAIASISGTVSGRWLESTVQIVPGSSTTGVAWVEGCYVHKDGVNVGP